MKNIEIKARLAGLARARETALRLGARPMGSLRQIDTFFPAHRGRLKLRQESTGSGDRAELIFYERPDEAGPKASVFDLVPVADPELLRRVLTSALGVRLEVRKVRELWMLDRTRIHLDTVEGLGPFLELEVAVDPGDDEGDRISLARRYLEEFGVRETDLVRSAYADLLEASASAGGAEDPTDANGAKRSTTSDAE